jgi:hypothetical protein
MPTAKNYIGNPIWIIVDQRKIELALIETML